MTFGSRRWPAFGPVRSSSFPPVLFPAAAQLFVGMIVILIFAEVLGLYGLIVALILSTHGSSTASCHAECFNPCCTAQANVCPIGASCTDQPKA